jgi:DNA gyrase subunit A
MGRATSGVIGMRFANGDELLGMYVVREGADVLVATAGGYAKRTPADEYPIKGRGTMGVVTARIVADQRGELVGALMVLPDDEVFAITSTGGVIRTSAAEVKQSGRQTMGVRLMNLASGDSVVAVARNAEAGAEVGVAADEADGEVGEAAGEQAGAEPAAGAAPGTEDVTASQPQDG